MERGLTTVDVAGTNGYTDNDYYHDMGERLALVLWLLALRR